MAVPTTAITRYDLSAPVMEFDLAMNRKKFIGPKVLRPRLVGIQAADVGKVPLKFLLTQLDGKRAPGSGYKRTDFEFDKFSYTCREYGIESVIDDATIAIYRDMLDAEKIATDRAIDGVCQQFERDCATAIYDTATWTGASLTTAITNEWDDHANAVPIDDVMAAKEKVAVGCGLEANALICNAYQFENLCQCSQVVDRVKYTARADNQTMAAAVADLLGVKYILSAGGFTNTANPQQTAAISRIWSSEYMMVARVAETDDPQEPCIGRTFIWTGDGPGSGGDGSELAVVVEEYREEARRGAIIRARNNRDIVVMYAAAGHLLSNAITI